MSRQEIIDVIILWFALGFICGVFVLLIFLTISLLTGFAKIGAI